MKHCPDCGRKTFEDTDCTDYDAGNKFVCLACGYVAWMSAGERREFFVENGKIEQYEPVYPVWHTILAKAASSMILREYSRTRLEENLNVRKGEYIRFRRYPPLLGEGV